MLVIAWIVLGAAGGGLLGGALGDLSANHRGDIGRVFAGLMFGGIIGAIACGIAAKALTRKFPADTPQRRWMIGATFIVPIVFVAGSFLIAALQDADRLSKSGGAARVVYEVHLPAGEPALTDKDIVQEFRTEKETRKQSFPGHDVNVDRKGDVVVIQGSFDTYRTANQRMVRLQIRNGPTYIYMLKLPARPPQGYAKDYSAWQAPDQIEDAGQPPRAPKPNETMQIRYKIDV